MMVLQLYIYFFTLMTMKKFLLMVAAGVAALGMGACCNNGSCDAKGDSCNSKKECDEKVYTGIVPAADCDGIRYTLMLDYSDNGEKGDYALVQNYFSADSVSFSGIKDVNNFKACGDFTVEKKDGNTYVKLGGQDNLIFLVGADDASLTQVNEAYEAPAKAEDYTLTLVK